MCNVECIPRHLLFVHHLFTCPSHLWAPTPHSWRVRECLCVLIAFPILCVLMSDWPYRPFSPLSVQTLFTELQEAGLITSEEFEKLSDPNDVVYVQSSKSPNIQANTADVLMRYGLEEDSNLLASEQTPTLISISAYVCCTVDSSWKDHSKTFIFVVYIMHTMLGHSKWVPERHYLPTWPPKRLHTQNHCYV